MQEFNSMTSARNCRAKQALTTSAQRSGRDYPRADARISFPWRGLIRGSRSLLRAVEFLCILMCSGEIHAEEPACRFVPGEPIHTVLANESAIGPDRFCRRGANPVKSSPAAFACRTISAEAVWALGSAPTESCSAYPTGNRRAASAIPPAAFQRRRRPHR